MTDRTIEKVRAYVASIEVPKRPAFVARQPRQPRRNLVPVAAALAVFAVLFVVVIRPDGLFMTGNGGSQKPALPDQFAAYSYLTAGVTKSPPGPVIALYNHGYGVELFDYPQELVLGAYADVYRKVDVAEANSGQVLLSPDGYRVMVGSRIPAKGMSIVDMITGQITRLPTEMGFTPAAWSPNLRYVAGIWQGWGADGGTLVLMDLETGRASTLEFKDVSMAAFSPDGSELAIQDGSKLLVIDLSGKLLRQLADGPTQLVNGTAWSPDGRLLLVWEDYTGLSFVDASGTGLPVPASIGRGGPQGAAWTGPGEVLAADSGGLTETDLRTGEQRVVSRFDPGPADNFHMGQMHFASALLLAAGTREASSWPERGPWPAWLQLIRGLLIALMVWIVVRWVRRRIPARVPVASDLSPQRDPPQASP